MRHCFESAYAKINLTLDVLAKRPDGYHDLRMIMQTVSLRDNLAIRVGCGGDAIKTVSNLGYLPDDDRNITVKAARAFFAATGISCDGVHIAVEKRIPVAAGLAGGSADGAAVLRALDRLYDTRLGLDALCEIGRRVGADIPFCIRGGTMLAEGVGEKLTALPNMPECYVVLCKPGYGMSTARVFGALNLARIRKHPDTERVLAAIDAGDLSQIAAGMYNVLEEVVSGERGDISAVEEALLRCGALGAMMSGSGSTTFGLFCDENSAKKAYEYLKKRYRETFLTKTCTIF